MTQKLKILNLYAGIGGNRKLWDGDIEVTAVEYRQDIADVYASFFPGDNVIVGDAHQYLLDHYKEFDFIWSSPPCPSHSDIRRCGVHSNQVAAIYPEMGLYQEIILLRHFAPKKTQFVVENVIPYYEPLIQPDKKLHRHYYWTNFRISDFEVSDKRKHNDIQGHSTIYGFNIKDTAIEDKRKTLRNMVDPELGLHIFNCAKGIFERKPTEQLTLL